MNRFKIVLSLIIMLGCLSYCSAETEPAELQTGSVKTETINKDNFIKAKYASAENRFVQSNTQASYSDFNDLIDRASHDDYVLLSYGIKMAEYGFFDLSEKLFAKLDSNTFTSAYKQDIRNFYYPSAMLNQKDVTCLADAYSNIVYNNMAIETVSELLNSTQTTDSDYKNYLIALGYYKSNNLHKALKYINNAILVNGTNINYKILKAKVLADSGKTKQALKILDEINKTPLLTTDFQKKLKASEEYILYKTAKHDTLKDYHLAYYYHLQDKSLLGTKVLQSALIQSKQYSPLIYSLLGKIYYDNNEPLKAEEFIKRAYKEDKNNYLAVLTLADLNFDNKKYSDALKYYKRAEKLSKETAPKVGVAKSYLALDNSKKSKKLYEKLLKKYKYDEELLAGALKIFPYRADDYLPRIASLDITNNEIWLGLASYAINDGNYIMAQTYLNNSYYIDENNFKYYYYLSLVLKARGEHSQAEQSLIKCSRLNSDYASELSAENTDKTNSADTSKPQKSTTSAKNGSVNK